MKLFQAIQNPFQSQLPNEEYGQAFLLVDKINEEPKKMKKIYNNHKLNYKKVHLTIAIINGIW